MSFEPTAQQRRAIEAPLGPVLVVAGPGAGKTFCLIYRIQHLIQQLGIAPRRVCAVTFTNKAAEEIATRLHGSLGGAGEEVTRGTLHALCLAILRQYPEQAGLRPGFGVADEDYQHRVLRRLGVPARRHTQLIELFGRHRLQAYPLTESDLTLFQEYRRALRERNLVDFDDLVTVAEALIRTHDFVAGDVCKRWDYVLVDEFQDLNLAQYAIVKRLAGQNLFAVGDDEQSIFSWTGAVPKILTVFGEDFSLRDPVILDHNHRCSVQIFAAARRLIGCNPASFDKRIEARRASDFEVTALAFEDENREADWLIRDLLEDHSSGDLSWGEYAVLYRYHKMGQLLEGKLVGEGVPCRVAKGQALLEDPVIAYVVASLHLIRSPDDPLVIDRLAELLLPSQLLQDVRVAPVPGADLLGRLRAYAQCRPRGDAEGKKIWRFVYHVENLRAVARSHDALPALVDELLSLRIGPARNPLEERYQDLSDPAAYPGAARLADRLRASLASGGRVWVEPDRGLEVGLIGMLRAAQVPNAERLTARYAPGPTDVVLRAMEVSHGRLPLLLFKALQLLHMNELREELADFVAFDLETTDGDVSACQIVEIAAVRVRQNRVVEQFRSLVQCTRSVSPLAHAVHGYSDADLQNQPSFEEVWPRFRAFVGRDLLVAHNGQEFDVPVLRRLAEGIGGIDDLVFYDTLPLVRSLIEGSAKLTDLARRFNISVGRAHQALPDALMLAAVVPQLTALKAIRARKAAMVHLLDYLGLCLALDGASEPHGEIPLLREMATVYVLGRYSDCLDFYAAELASGVEDAPSLAEVIERLGGVALMERLRAQRTAAERYPAAVARLEALVEASRGDDLAQRLEDMLARVALSSCVGVETDPNRVNLLTLHSTKGLEFSRVYIVGVENQQLPGWKAIQENLDDEIQEARRLLYVGMTRAKDRLTLTRADRRLGVHCGGSLFLTEAGLVPEFVGTSPALEPQIVPSR
jgi:superfamily I DNA/RNA helicase/DNA polymerase III epsilon subunit-like protein